jgi:hypothetical protein
VMCKTRHRAFDINNVLRPLSHFIHASCMEEEEYSCTIPFIATMSNLFRDTTFGHVIRFAFSNRFLQYLEERDCSLSRTRSKSPETLEECQDADVVGWWNSQDSEVRYPCCYTAFVNDILCRTHEVSWEPMAIRSTDEHL